MRNRKAAVVVILTILLGVVVATISLYLRNADAAKQADEEAWADVRTELAWVDALVGTAATYMQSPCTASSPEGSIEWSTSASAVSGVSMNVVQGLLRRGWVKEDRLDRYTKPIDGRQATAEVYKQASPIVFVSMAPASC